VFSLTGEDAMPSTSIKVILETAVAGRTLDAVRLSKALRRDYPDCPYLLVFHAILIQSLDTVEDDYTLDDAEVSLLRAHEVDKSYLPALEELAHFYDAVKPDPAKARTFAAAYIEKIRPILERMQIIVAESDNVSDDEAKHE
jgi:hypothetical protein